MRILHIFESYNDWSGARALKRISEELARRGHTVMVATGRMRGEAEEEAVNGVSVYRFSISGNVVRGIKGSRAEIARYQAFVQNATTDIILTYAAQSWATDLVLPFLGSLRAKKVFVPVGYSRLGHSAYRSYFAKLPELLQPYDAFIYLSEHYRDYTFDRDSGLHQGKVVRVIPNFAEEEEFLSFSRASFRKKFDLHGRPLVISVGNHVQAKNHAMLLRVIARLKRNDIYFALIGNPYTFPKSCWPVCKIFSKLKRNVGLFSYLPRHLVVAAWQEADVALLTSRLECDPLVMYEAFASRTPLVATPVGSIPEFSDVVKIVKTPKEMAQKAAELLRDTFPREKMVDKAFNLWQEHYTLAKTVDKYESLYQTLTVRL